MGAVTVIKFECDRCQQRIEATGEMLGTSIDCPNCSMRLSVPCISHGASTAGVGTVQATLATQGVTAAGLACLVAGLALISRYAALPLAGLLLLGTLVAGGMAWRRRMGVVGGVLILAAVLAPWLFLPSAEPPAAPPTVAWTEGTWTEGADARPMAVPSPAMEAPRRPMLMPQADAVDSGLASASRSDAEGRRLPDSDPEPPWAGEPEPEQESEPVLSPLFSDDPFRDVFGPVADDPEPEGVEREDDAVGLVAESPLKEDLSSQNAAIILDSDRIVLALIDAPDNAALLEALRGEIGAIANEDKKVRLIAAYALGCLHIGKRQEAAQVQGYLNKHYPSHPLGKLLAPNAILMACAACDGTGTMLQACPDCRGEGACQRCAGSGQRALPGMDGTTRSVACVTCRGNGQCRRCQGVGQVSVACGVCQGTGKVLAEAAIRTAYMDLLEGRTP